jgi:predicted TIM-barrel fold metal-dependent hydrolase
MKNGFRIVDTELHLVEPTDLWTKNLEEPYRSRTKVIHGPSGKAEDAGKRFEIGGQMMGASRAPNEWEQLVRKQGRRRFKEQPHLREAAANCVPEVYLRGMDTEGIDLALLMPTLTFQATTWDDMEPGHALAMCRAYNNFAHQFTLADPARLRFWAWLPRHDATLAAQEARRCIEELGAIGAALPMRAVNGHILTEDFFEPLWVEMERLNKPIGFHVGGSPKGDDIRARYNGRRAGGLVGRAMARQFYGSTTAAELILGGILERHPGLRVIVMEAAVSWLPWLLWCMDELWEMYAEDLDYPLPIAPSAYFKRQCHAVVDCGEEAARVAVDYGLVDNLIGSTDYPHHDSLFPHAIDTFLGLKGLDEQAKRKILWDNAARLFNLT